MHVFIVISTNDKVITFQKRREISATLFGSYHDIYMLCVEGALSHRMYVPFGPSGSVDSHNKTHNNEQQHVSPSMKRK
eukprot:COSAG01_NODE_10093_length_2252_cov_1.667441_3_plen_78_part_00